MMKRETKSVRVDPELWKKAKLQAVMEDKTVGKIVEEGLKVRLGKKKLEDFRGEK